ncbi:hypothetical protein IT568_09585 [bacterium]|nr:hypothetical protein [bacterium]
MFLKLFSLLLVFALIGCSHKPKFGTHFQGINGKVVFYKGNFMPGTNKSSGTITPVERKIIVFKAIDATKKQAIDGVFYKDLKAEKVGETVSDKNGNFKIGLPAGKYTVLVEEEKGLYGNGTDGNGILVPVDIFPNQETKLELKITYEAFF